MLSALREPNSLRGGQIVRGPEFGLALGQTPRAPLELRLLLREARFVRRDLGRASRQLAVVAAGGQRLAQTGRERVHVVRGDLHAQDETVMGGVLGHGESSRSMSGDP